MISVNKRLYNNSVRHQIGILRYSSGVVRSAVGQFNGMVPALLGTISGHDPYDGPGNVSKARLDNMLSSIHALMTSNGKDISAVLDNSVKDLISSEVEHTVASIDSAIPTETVRGVKAARIPIIVPTNPILPKKPVVVDPLTQYINEPDLNFVKPAQFALVLGVPTNEQVYGAVNAKPFEGKVLSDYYQDLPEDNFDALQAAITKGYTMGMTTDQIVRQLRGTRAAQYSDGTLQSSRRSIERTVRTALNHTATVSRDQVYQTNSDVVDSVMWVSTLDMRTSDICIALDGQVFPIDSGPRPPAHFNCRSCTAPVTKSWSDLGFNADELTSDTRASMDGQVPATQTYGSWLGDQSDDVQNQVLGPTRAALFRDGGLTVDKFVDGSGNTLTIDQLRAQDADAFTQAGLN